MRIGGWVLAGLALMTVGGCDRAEVAEARDIAPTAGRGFTVELPQGVRLETREPPGPDFDVHGVYEGDTQLVGIYIGGFASFPADGFRGRVSPESANPRTAEAQIMPGRIQTQEYLWRTGCHWPRQIHVFVYDPERASDVAYRVAASVKPGPCLEQTPSP